MTEENSPRTRFLLLLVSLLALMVLEPFLFDYIRLRFLLDIFFTIILFASIYAVSEKKRTLLIAILLALPKLGTIWALNFTTQPLLLLIDSICGVIFIGYIILLILTIISRQKEVTRETIYGAIVVYILIGIMWVYFYQFTDVLHPHSFSISAAPDDPQKSFYYYSFVTLTTLGYGDITPISGPARAMTTLEAILGQMYLAVTIARLVGMHISQGMLKK